MKLLLSSKLCMSCQFIIKAEKVPLFSIYKDAFSICTFDKSLKMPCKLVEKNWNGTRDVKRKPQTKKQNQFSC